MKKLGIIAEYNPFHNGHLYHIQKSKEITAAEGTVVVMSGHFMQRGDLAICDKWKRAEMAVLGGADLVVELPVCFSCRSAADFAYGGVKILEALGTDYISFGAETDDISCFSEIAHFLKSPPAEFESDVAKNLKTGMSYPSAVAAALKNAGFGNIADTPNNILAIEYLKANTSMQPVFVRRSGSEHDGFGSASYIRRLIYEGKDFSDFVPDFTEEIIKKAIDDGTAPVGLSGLDTVITSKLRTSEPEEIAKIADVCEGLENRIKNAAMAYACAEAIADAVKTKRYTHARIRRILLNSLIGTSGKRFKPEYIRILALNDTGAKIIREIKDKCPLEIITKPSVSVKSDMLLSDFCATDIYSLAFPSRNKRVGGLDMITSPIKCSERRQPL